MSPKARVLVVDDDRAVGMVLTALLTQAGYQARHVLSADAALAALASSGVDLVLSDVRMPGMDGMELLSEIQKRHRDVPVVLLTAHGTVDLAVQAMKAGAADFLAKPFDRDEVLFTLGKCLTSVAHAAQRPPEPAVQTRSSSESRASSPAMSEVTQRLRKAAPTLATVLLRGESGTGKEVAARELHRLSGRKGPFLAVHCGALPDNLLESELFGYERGAFTGAQQRKPGRVELAEGGTLFLDEIGDITPAFQVKLLRLLQEREYQPLGATSAAKADVRFVAATHRDLAQMVREGAFREDLFYRLNVVALLLPPLRDRLEDLRPLADHFVAEHARMNGRGTLRLTDDAHAALREHAWPGNIRELGHFLERLVVFAEGEAIRAEDVRRELAPVGLPPSAGPSSGESASLGARRAEAEKEAIVDALERAGGNRSQAARLLGVSRRTLYNKLADFGLQGM